MESPEEPIKIIGIEGYQTFAIDNKTIGIRPKWISVKDKLPPLGKPCLLYQTWPAITMFNLRADPLERTHISLGGINWEGKFITYENQYNDYLDYVSHWMPLPEVPHG